MATVGRNDPCPCGSGKKYKHCHWRIDREIQRQNVELEHAWQTLGQRILRFGIQERFAYDTISAWNLFWDNKVPIESMEALEPVHRNRFFDWYAYDYRTSIDRKRVAELFLDENESELSPLERDLVRDWVNTHLSVYQVTGVTEARVDLQDVFTTEARSLNEAGADRYLSPGVLLLGRLLPVGSSLRFAPAVTPLPAHGKVSLLDTIKPRFTSWQQARYGADWKDFLNESGYLLNHFLIRDMEPMEAPAIEESEIDPVQAARSIARRMQSEVITSSLDQHYERWLNKPVPEWGGKTPREMVATAEGTDRVEIFLSILQDVERERARSGQPTYDVNLLRRKLGLIREARTEGGIVLPR
jgi:hypothetical protein